MGFNSGFKGLIHLSLTITPSDVIYSELLTAMSNKIPINRMNAILTPHDSRYGGMTLVRQVTWKVTDIIMETSKILNNFN